MARGEGRLLECFCGPGLTHTFHELTPLASPMESGLLFLIHRSGNTQQGIRKLIQGQTGQRRRGQGPAVDPSGSRARGRHSGPGLSAEVTQVAGRTSTLHGRARSSRRLPVLGRVLNNSTWPRPQPEGECQDSVGTSRPAGGGHGKMERHLRWGALAAPAQPCQPGTRARASPTLPLQQGAPYLPLQTERSQVLFVCSIGPGPRKGPRHVCWAREPTHC